MYSKSVLILALACFGASSNPLGSNVGVGLNGVCGPTVSETVVTPFHRTDALTTPCARSVLHTTISPYNLNLAPGAAAFLGAGGVMGAGYGRLGAGAYPGVLGSGIAGTGAGLYSTGVGANLAGNAAGVYPGAGYLGTGVGAYQTYGVANGVGAYRGVSGVTATGAFRGVNTVAGCGGFTGVAGTGILGGGAGIYPGTATVI